ncbi:methyltransferase domain-containing protein [Streptomyces seoulensis]|uniref:Methyltransferase domain-containing protein n=1 Tax=Streptomyces seoulensis TaxID=73044 RepID=A0A4P6TZT0_STRSO|nr:methyltransferase domain-containing protein [Streptomyces seoulensis]QBJ92537.1 methyltransferase domain-containing protein [Streptomyces seoulensis]
MTPTLVREHLAHAGSAPPRVNPRKRARDWSEIQERMLLPLHETVHERLEVGPGTRLLGLACGSGLALLLAAAKGAAVTGVDSRPEHLALARERLDPDGPLDARLVQGDSPADAADDDSSPYTLVTAYETVGALDDSGDLGDTLAAALPLAARGAAVVLAGWGPPERCATSTVLRVAAKLAEPLRGAWRPARRDDLEEVARGAGLRPDGSGRVACPFGYADTDSAVRGLVSTGLFDAAIAATDRKQVGKELTESLHPYRRPDGTVWMPNVFRYLIARVP